HFRPDRLRNPSEDRRPLTDTPAVPQSLRMVTMPMRPATLVTVVTDQHDSLGPVVVREAYRARARVPSRVHDALREMRDPSQSDRGDYFALELLNHFPCVELRPPRFVDEKQDICPQRCPIRR